MRLDTGLLLGLLTVSVTALGIVLARRGQKEQARQQGVANELADRAERFDEMNKMLAGATSLAELLRTQMKSMEEAHDEALRRQARRCHETVDRLVDAVANLQTVVQDEVARAAAFMAVEYSRRHVREHDVATEGPDEAVSR